MSSPESSALTLMSKCNDVEPRYVPLLQVPELHEMEGGGARFQERRRTFSGTRVLPAPDEESRARIVSSWTTPEAERTTKRSDEYPATFARSCTRTFYDNHDSIAAMLFRWERGRTSFGASRKRPEEQEIIGTTSTTRSDEVGSVVQGEVDDGP
ncbi:unnamed protein product, partial [Amoebophrya sp. A25]|eukprot:GSA25T00004297001.1